MNISTYESRIKQLQDGGGGYDLVIEVNNHSSVGHITAAEIVGGSFESAYTKALRGEFINVKIFAYADLGADGIFYRDFIPAAIYADQGYHDAIIINLVGTNSADPTINAGSKYAANSSGGTVNQKIYASNTSKSIIVTESGVTVRTNQ